MPQLDPFSPEAEQSVLGSILIDADSIHRVRAILDRPEKFHIEKHQWIYKAILDLADDSVPPDFLTVQDILEQRGQLKAAGNSGYITSLINLVPTSIHAEHYARIVERDYVRRRAIAYGSQIVQDAHKAEDVNELMASINAGLIDLEMQQDRGGPQAASVVVGEFYDDLQYWQANPLEAGQVRGLSTGISEWDKMMGGMENGESLVVIAARSRTGKTAIALTSAYRLARIGKRVLFFALEMKAKTLIARLASAESGVSYKKIKRGTKDGSNWYASSEEFSRFTRKVLGIGAATIYWDDTQDLTVPQVRARAMTLAHRLGGLDLIVVDTGNLVRSENVRGKNFAQVESDKIRGLRNLIKELDCVGYVTWQLLTKKIDARPSANMGRAPTLGDLRDTGGVEEHASDVIALYRDELDNENSQYKNVMHLFALKRRNDEDSTMQTVGFDPQFQRFYSVDLRSKEY